MRTEPGQLADDTFCPFRPGHSLVKDGIEADADSRTARWPFCVQHCSNKTRFCVEQPRKNGSSAASLFGVNKAGKRVIGDTPIRGYIFLAETCRGFARHAYSEYQSRSSHGD